MSVLDAGKAYLFSPVELTVTKDGAPLAGATVIRRWEQNSLQHDQATTDSEGKVRFADVRGRSVVQVIPAEFVVAQQIVVLQGDEEIEIWSNSKRDSALNAELGGKPMELVCELTDEEQMYRDFGSALFTKCSWR